MVSKCACSMLDCFIVLNGCCPEDPEMLKSYGSPHFPSRSCQDDAVQHVTSHCHSTEKIA